MESARFSRAVVDLETLPRARLKSDAGWDPWGNEYIWAAVSGGGCTYEYAFSRGPDGESKTLGSDPDDIAVWTEYDVWMRQVYPMRFTRSAMLVSCTVLVTLLSVWLLQRNRRETRPNKSE